MGDEHCCCNNDSKPSENKNVHPRVRVDQAVRPLPPKTLSILVGLVLKLISMCNHNLKIWKSLDSLICFDYVFN